MDKMEVVEKPLRVLSLFSGCGGMDLGFEGGFRAFKASVGDDGLIESEINSREILLKRTRFETVFANDILKDAKNCWINYFSKRGRDASSFHQESIVDLVKRHKGGEKVFPDMIDVVTGGFPCQDFSVSGLRNGLDSKKDHLGQKLTASDASVETRGQLYMWMKEVIEITKPKIFIAENVKGLVSLGDVRTIIQKDFSKAASNGYFVFDPRVLHAANFGVPQSRERVIFIGVRKDALNKKILNVFQGGNIPPELDPYPKQTHFKDSNEKSQKWVPLKEIFKGLKEPELSNDVSQQHYSKAKFGNGQGQTEVKLDSIGPTIRAEHHGNIEYRRHSQARGGKCLKELEKGFRERRLSVRECALIQTFPADYEFVIPSKTPRKFVVSASGAYKVIGNAVPPLLAFHVACRLESLWNVYFGENTTDDSIDKPLPRKSRLRETAR